MTFRILLFFCLLATSCREHPQRTNHSNPATAEDELLREASDIYLWDTVTI